MTVRVRVRVSIVIVFAAALTGCGGGKGGTTTASTAAKPPESARQVVVQFIAALQSGRTAAACGMVGSGAEADLRENALGSAHVHDGTLANRIKQVQVHHAQASTCEGVMALIASETKASLPKVLAKARTEPLSWIGPASAGEVMIGGDEDWDVARHGDRWQIDTINALP